MGGNLFEGCGVTERFAKTAAGPFMSLIIIILTVAIGGTMAADTFLNLQTLMIVILGLIAFAFGTASGVITAKIMSRFLREKINPLIRSPGIASVPITARVSHIVAHEENPNNHLIYRAMGPNLGRVFGAAISGGVLFALLGVNFDRARLRRARGLGKLDDGTADEAGTTRGSKRGEIGTKAMIPDTLPGALVLSLIDFVLSFVIVSGMGLILALFPVLNRVGKVSHAELAIRTAKCPCRRSRLRNGGTHRRHRRCGLRDSGKRVSDRQDRAHATPWRMGSGRAHGSPLVSPAFQRKALTGDSHGGIGRARYGVRSRLV
jgi:hypothetical protein